MHEFRQFEKSRAHGEPLLETSKHPLRFQQHFFTQNVSRIHLKPEVCAENTVRGFHARQPEAGPGVSSGKRYPISGIARALISARWSTFRTVWGHTLPIKQKAGVLGMMFCKIS